MGRSHYTRPNNNVAVASSLVAKNIKHKNQELPFYPSREVANIKVCDGEVCARGGAVGGAVGGARIADCGTAFSKEKLEKHGKLD